MRTVLTVLMFLGLLVFSDFLWNDGNVSEPLWQLLVRSLR